MSERRNTATATISLGALAAAFALSACGGNPVVPFPTAGPSSVGAPQVGAAPIGPAATAGTFTYSCNEGIPLVVVMDPGGASLRYSHDGFPYQQMTQIPAASGAAYTDGSYDLHLSGSQALLAYRGGAVFDQCNAV